MDEHWVIDQGESKIAELLKPLGHNKDCAKYILKAAYHFRDMWKGVMPRDYCKLMELDGVGPKIALLTIYEVYRQMQGIPMDIHMLRQFTSLGWVPDTTNLFSSTCAFLEPMKEKTKPSYKEKVCWAALESYIPKVLWEALNPCWAGFGQLMRESTEARKKVVDYLNTSSHDFDSSIRAVDRIRFLRLLAEYE